MLDLSRSPFIVIWETTRACALACVHCRASAQLNPLPGELTPEEGLALVDEIAALGTRILVLSGGDPLMRADLTTLIRRGKALGLRVATIPAATPRLTEAAITALADAGIDQLAFSLDASTAEAHDRIRGVPGTFQKTLEAIEWTHEVKVPVQVNTVISRSNLDELDRLISLVRRLGIVFWEVFFLVPVGRGGQLQSLTAGQYERVFARLYSLTQQPTFVLKVTEAPHFRRHVIERTLIAQGINPRTLRWSDDVLPPELQRRGPGGSIGLAPQSINAGKGHCFIAHDGAVYPSGFLPLAVGNVRTERLATLYQASPVMRALRDPACLRGKCGGCEYRAVCGGSRSRAYAVSGDYLAEDPCCAYRPAVAVSVDADS